LDYEGIPALNDLSLPRTMEKAIGGIKRAVEVIESWKFKPCVAMQSLW
jgi:hypothetical protein